MKLDVDNDTYTESSLIVTGCCCHGNNNFIAYIE